MKVTPLSLVKLLGPTDRQADFSDRRNTRVARLHGARSVADLPGYVDAFVDNRVSESRDARRGTGDTLAKDIRGPVDQFLELVIPGFEGTGRPHHAIPFAGLVPGFFEYLTSERGLRPASVTSYRHHLDRFGAFLQRVGDRRFPESAD